MILLDTNYLINGLVSGSPEQNRLFEWSAAKNPLITAAVCWYEFLCGPVTPPQISAMKALLNRVVPYGEKEAAEAARLFNQVGRVRSLRVDAMIAATAVVVGAPLATANHKEFERFEQASLKLL